MKCESCGAEVVYNPSRFMCACGKVWVPCGDKEMVLQEYRRGKPVVQKGAKG